VNNVALKSFTSHASHLHFSLFLTHFDFSRTHSTCIGVIYAVFLLVTDVHMCLLPLCLLYAEAWYYFHLCTINFTFLYILRICHWT